MNNNQKRILFLTLTIVFSLAIPILVIAIKYDMIRAFFNAPTKIKLSAIGCILILIVLLVNLKRIKEYLKESTFSVFKCIVNGIIKIAPIICMLLLLVNVTKLVDDLTFIVSWLLGCNVISLFIFEPLYQYYKKEYLLDIEYKKWHKRELNEQETKV